MIFLDIENIKEFVNDEIWNTDNEFMPIYEGVLWRYMPGFVQHFHPRYCLITKSAFFYFEDKQKSLGNNPKPLVAISISSIESAQRVKVAIPEEKQIKEQYKKRHKLDYVPTSILPRYQFEVFLKKQAEILQEEEKDSTNILLGNDYSKDYDIAKSFSEKKTKSYIGYLSSAKSVQGYNDNQGISNYLMSNRLLSEKQVIPFILIETFDEKTFHDKRVIKRFSVFHKQHSFYYETIK